MILAQLHGAKPEYTGVVQHERKPVYVDNRLLGRSRTIGQFTKDPIAGITPIEQMMQCAIYPSRFRAIDPGPGVLRKSRRIGGRYEFPGHGNTAGDGRVSARAIKLWQQQMRARAWTRLRGGAAARPRWTRSLDGSQGVDCADRR